MKLSRQAAIGIRVMEECNELAQRVSKALLFGIEERQPGQDLTNRDRIYQEFFDLRAVLGMFGIDAWINDDASKAAERAKCEKVERFMQYAISLGEQTPNRLVNEVDISEQVFGRATKDDLDELLTAFDGSVSDVMEKDRYLRLSAFLKRAIDKHLEE